MAIAWAKQSKSLVRVQRTGKGLEKKAKSILRSKFGWTSGRIIYDHVRGYDLQVDFAAPSLDAPKAIVSVTYTAPDIRGHSNENKLHLKVPVSLFCTMTFASCAADL